MPVAQISALHISEIHYVVEFIVSVDLRDKFVLLETREGRLLVPADGRFGEVDTADPPLEGQIC